MKISEVTIKNFRALKHVSIPLRQFSVLIGQNDAGKTSVLHALSRFYEGKKLSSPDDWYKRPPREEIQVPIDISVTYSEIPADVDVQTVADGDKLTVLRRFDFNAPPVTMAIIGGKEVAIDKAVAAKINKLVSGDNFVFVPVRRDIASQFKLARNSVLGALLHKKWQKTLEDPQVIKDVANVANTLTESLQNYQNRMGLFMREQAHNDEIELKFANLNVNPLDGVSFTPLISDLSSGAIPIENRGAGTQNNLIISLFRLVAEEDEAKEIIFALEEPENSLHPQAQRQLFTAIQALSQKSQTIVTTHSPVFIDRGDYANNILLTRQPQTGNTKPRIFDEKMLEAVRVDMGIKASDALLKGGGNCAILVEGDTEEDAYPVFMEMMGMSASSLGISVINMRCGDGKSYSRAIKLLQAFGIPCIAVLDGDEEGRQATADLEREVRAKSLPNLKEIFCLEKDPKKGDFLMEDFYPLSIIADTINNHLSPPKKIQDVDFDATLRGRARNKNIISVMLERGAGKPESFLKTRLGAEGTEEMKNRDMPVPPKLKEILEFAKATAATSDN